METTTEPSMTVAEVAAMHRISRATVYRAISRGELEARRVRFQYRIAPGAAAGMSRAAEGSQA